MNQVHKETLTSVDNALPNRSDLNVEIFGMEGIPEEIVQAHNQRIITQFYQAEAERRAATGNPGPGAAQGNAAKKPKHESPADLKKRLAEHKARMAEQAAGGSSGTNTPMGSMDNAQSPAMGQSPGSYVSNPFSPNPASGLTRHVERLPLPCYFSTATIWRTTRCESRLIHSRSICTTCASLPTALCSPTTSLLSRSSIPSTTSTILSTPAVRTPTALCPARCHLWSRRSSICWRPSTALRWLSSWRIQSIPTTISNTAAARLTTSKARKSSSRARSAPTPKLWCTSTKHIPDATDASRPRRLDQWLEPI
jgi:hypothetical protein